MSFFCYDNKMYLFWTKKLQMSNYESTVDNQQVWNATKRDNIPHISQRLWTCALSQLQYIRASRLSWGKNIEGNNTNMRAAFCFFMRDVVISLSLKLPLCVPFCLTTLFPIFIVFLAFLTPYRIITNIFYCCLVELLLQAHWECFMDSLLVFKAVCSPVRDCCLIPSPNCG